MHYIQYGLLITILFVLSFLYTWNTISPRMIHNLRHRINITNPQVVGLAPIQAFKFRTVLRSVEVSRVKVQDEYTEQYVNNNYKEYIKENSEQSLEDINNMCSENKLIIGHARNGSIAPRGLIDFYIPILIQDQNQLCKPNEDVPNGLFLLIQVHSHPAHKERRDAIRASWGSVVRNFNTPLHIGLVFLLGVSNISQELNYAVQKEGKLYRDIVQGNFTDSYRNLTIKSIMGLYWTNTFCCNAKYVLKTDDDVYYNMSLLISILKELPDGNKQRRDDILVGSIYEDSQVMREGQWQVKLKDFPFSVYPPYCAGAAYVMSPDVSLLLLTTFIKDTPKPLLTIEDAYITGFLANAANRTCKHNELFPNWMSTPSLRTFAKFFNRKVLAIHGVPYAAMYQIDKLIRLCKDCGTNMSKLKDWFVWIGRNASFGT